MNTVLMVVAKDVFRDEEFTGPMIALEDAGIRVKVASTEPGEAYGKLGTRIIVEQGLDEIDPDEYDAIIFVGGSGASVFFDDPLAHKIARTLYEDGKIVAAICIAPSTLAHAGLLEGKKVTAFETQEQDLVAHGATYTGNPVEVDGNIVTANGPAAATVFGETIRDMLLAKKD